MENLVSVPLFVDDYDKAIDFYCNQTKLFKIISDTKINSVIRYVLLEYQHYEIAFSLILEYVNSDLENKLVGKQGGNGAFIYLPVNNCRQLYEKFLKNNITPLNEPTSYPFFTQLDLIDPFGNIIYLMQK